MCPMDWLIVWAIVMLTGAAATPDDSDHWRVVLAHLDEARAGAFTDADVSGLDAVYPAGSELQQQDRDLLGSYRERGLTLDGMHMRVRSLEVLDRTATSARLSVVDQLGPTRVRTADGHWRELPSDRPTRRIVTLELTAAGWRITSAQTQ